MEILPTGLPDLSITSKPTNNLKTRKMLETLFKNNLKNRFYCFLCFARFLGDLEVIERSGTLIAFIPPIFVHNVWYGNES